MSQSQEMGYWIDETVVCMAVRDGRAGMLTDALVDQHNSTAHAQGSPTWRGKQMIVTSLDDITIIMLM